MLTNPNTLGVFDRNIEEIAKIVHDVGRDALLRRREPQRRDGPRAAGRHGVRHRPLQPAQDVHAAARRRRPGRRADRGLGPDRAVPAAAAGGRSARTGRFDLDFDRPQSIGRLRGFQGNFGVFVRSYAYILSLGADGLAEASRHRGAERQLPDGAAARARAASTSRRRSTAPACTSSCSPAAPMKKALGHPDAGPRQAAARPRLPPADGLLPAARRRGAADRADRDRDARDARRVRRGRRCDPARGGGGPVGGAERAV